MPKITVGVLCGGESSEHRISLLSAANVIAELSKEHYKIVPIGIDRKGNFFLYRDLNFIIHPKDPKRIHLRPNGEPVTFEFGASRRLVFLRTKEHGPKIDVLFPVLHGAFGEDGTIQGLSELAHIPYVGCDVLGSAIGMDKDVTKRLLRDAGILVADFLTIHQKEKSQVKFISLKNDFGLPFFVKPACSGSSVGVSKVHSEREWKLAMESAFIHGEKILVEKMVQGKEIECSILGNNDPLVSIPGEVIPQHDFYSYEAKYLDEHGAQFNIPAEFSSSTIKKIQRIVLQTYRVLACRGMARVDGFLLNDGSFLINEINSIPGFTSISMYPKLWEASGLSYGKLLDRLIELSYISKHR